VVRSNEGKHSIKPALPLIYLISCYFIGEISISMVQVSAKKNPTIAINGQASPDMQYIAICNMQR
jgi:hypothetical protein